MLAFFIALLLFSKGRHIVAEFKPFKDLVFLSFQDFVLYISRQLQQISYKEVFSKISGEKDLANYHPLKCDRSA